MAYSKQSITVASKIFTKSFLYSSLLLAINFTHINQVVANTEPNEQPTNTSINGADGIVAIVNDSTILKSELADAVSEAKQHLQTSHQKTPSDEQLQSQLLNSLILRELQLSLVNRIGIKPTDEAINLRLLQIAKAQGLGNVASLQQQLDRQKFGSYAKLRQRVIEDTAIQALQQRQIASRIRITDQDVDAFLASPEAQKLDQSEYQTIHVRVPYPDNYNNLSDNQLQETLHIAQQVKQLLTDGEDVQAVMKKAQSDNSALLQGGDMGYHQAKELPIELANQITKLKVGEVSQPLITPNGIDIVKLANKRDQKQMVIPQWHTRHILIKVDEQQNNNLAQQKINDLYNQLKNGADFADLASTYSDDPGTAGRGGDLDWVSYDQMVPKFEEVMINTPIGKFSTPFKTQFGWHILQIIDKRQQNVSDIYQKNMAKELLFQRAAPQALEDWLQELKATAYIKILN